MWLLGGLRELATVLDFAEKDESYGVLLMCVEVEPDRPTKPVVVAVADPTPVTPTAPRWTTETVSKAVKGAGLTEKMVSRVVRALDDGKGVVDAVSWAIGCDHGRRFDRAVAGLSACAPKAT